MADGTGKTMVRATWIGIGLSVAVAVAGWTVAGVQKFSDAQHDILKQEIEAESKARATSDSMLTDAVAQINQNTKDIPAISAELHIVMMKLGLDGR